jgi:hypothetical protein
MQKYNDRNSVDENKYQITIELLFENNACTLIYPQKIQTQCFIRNSAELNHPSSFV